MCPPINKISSGFYAPLISNTRLFEYVLGNKISNIIDISKLPRAGSKSLDFNIDKIYFHTDIAGIREDDTITFELEFKCLKAMNELVVGFSITDTLDAHLIECRSTASIPIINIERSGSYTIRVSFKPNLRAGVYVLNIGARNVNGFLEYIPSVTNIEILPSGEYEEWNKPSAGIMNTFSEWNLIH